MAETYDISWQGCLYEDEKQRDFINELSQLAKIYNEKYFGEDKDDTTLTFFDNITLSGNILISTSLLYDIPKDCPEDLIIPLKKNPNEKYYFSCNQVKLYGLQFLVKADPIYTRKNRNYLETVAYVFWGFNSTIEKKPFVKSNIARVLKCNNPVTDGYEYKLESPALSSRFLILWYVIHLYEYAEHYYFKELEIENTMYWGGDPRGGFTKYLLKNDPLANIIEKKMEAFKDILQTVESHAIIGREADDNDIKNGLENKFDNINDNNNYCDNE